MASAIEKPESTAPKSSPSKNASKMHRRSRSGCFTCRLRRKKCDEGKPKCRACRNLGLSCEYKRPIWWSNNETRRNQKDEIKSIIKRTKTNEKNAPPLGPRGSHHHHHLSQHQMSGPSSPDSDDDDYDQSMDQSFAASGTYYDAYGVPMYAPHLSQPPTGYNGYPYEVDVKTERQMFINDVPTRRDSSISTFSTWVPPPPANMLPSYTGEEWPHHPQHSQSMDSYYTAPQPSRLNTEVDDLSHEEDLDFNFFSFSHPQQALHATHIPQKTEPSPINADVSAMIPLEDVDRPLFGYMLTNVLPLLFPILNANQHGSVRSDILLPSLENNKAYLHSCLNAAAVHQKAALGNQAHPVHFENVNIAQIDSDILRHKFSFVQEVVNALSNDTQHVEILEATLGMISLSTCVGRTPPPSLPSHSLPSPTGDGPDVLQDISWHSHFQAATELIMKLNLPVTLESMAAAGGSPPFNMTLAAWIDILGSTMLGRSPTFANTYRNMHLNGSTSGLAELMGCHDGVMYLLSEVACLDSLKRDGKLEDVAICSHITSLAQQLDATENVPGTDEHGNPTTHAITLQSPYSRSGALRPRQLSKNITAIFRKAARVYLCSLVPNATRSDPAICALVAQMAEMMQYIPSGPGGFDRSIVWPYLICGANSVPNSPFRRILQERIDLLGEEAEVGSIGRMVRLLSEVWRRNDDVLNGCEATPVTAGGHSPVGSMGVRTPVVGNTGTMGAAAGQQVTPTKSGLMGGQAATSGQSVHWRDVMQANGWDFLLI